jgi:uncharacterized damage-inducible protein DinB
MTMTLSEGVNVDPLIVVLDQLYDVIDRLSDEQYAQKPIGVITSSIGAHVRHCLDHVRELLRVTHSRALDYDRRERGTDVETRRCAALELIEALRQQLIELPPDLWRRPLSVSTMLASDRPPMIVHSTVAREVAFVLSHTIHHHALIGVMVKSLGGSLPGKFGYAPSTVAHLASAEGRPCARSA